MIINLESQKRFYPVIKLEKKNVIAGVSIYTSGKVLFQLKIICMARLYERQNDRPSGESSPYFRSSIKLFTCFKPNSSNVYGHLWLSYNLHIHEILLSLETNSAFCGLSWSCHYPKASMPVKSSLWNCNCLWWYWYLLAAPQQKPIPFFFLLF